MPSTPPIQTFFLLVSTAEPHGHRFVPLSAPSVLAWFRRAWALALAGRNWRRELRGEVYGLDSLFEWVARSRKPAPDDDKLVLAAVRGQIYAEGGVDANPHCISVETDDDEVDIKYWFFDRVGLSDENIRNELPTPESLSQSCPDDEDEIENDEEDEDAVLVYSDFYEEEIVNRDQ